MTLVRIDRARPLPRLLRVTLEQLAARIGALAGRDVRLRPDLSSPPHRWVATVRGGLLPAETIAAELSEPGVRAVGDELVVTLDDEQVDVELDCAAGVSGVEPVTPRDDRPLTLTRDGGRKATFAELAAEVGYVSAGWAVLRSSDGHQIDCASNDLAGLTPRNPVFPLLLAVSRLTRGLPDGIGAGAVAAATAEWSFVVADARRTGRTRPLALHLEGHAAAVCSWSESPNPGEPSTPAFGAWTGERLARTSRIVLVAGLSVAGIDAPTRI